ncbi:sodium:proton antiporter [Noviherbaspirillum agri]
MGGNVTALQIIGGIVFLIALFGYLNHRFIRLPDAIGITAFGMAASVAAVIASAYFPAFADSVRQIVSRIDFANTLLHGILGMLLFAGSMHIRFDQIRQEKWSILLLATVGVALSTAIVGAMFFLAAKLLGHPVPLLQCLLFGALISPTDPVAVLAILKRTGVPKSLEIRIAGESLFNDGTGVVVFLTLLGLATGTGHSASFGGTALLFATEVLGGVVFGVVAGYAGFLMLRDVDSYAVEILITVAMATAGYAAAEALHVSAPIAVVVMGLITGNHGKQRAMSEVTQMRLFEFWEVLDELLNLVLFGLIGLEMVVLTYSVDHAVIGIAAIAIVLAARLLSIAGPILATPRLRAVADVTLPVMAWGGLRGGISIALALSLPDMAGKELILSSTYAVVIFSLLVQALTLGKLARWRMDRARENQKQQE